jgi:hypothetical protein
VLDPVTVIAGSTLGLSGGLAIASCYCAGARWRRGLLLHEILDFDEKKRLFFDVSVIVFVVGLLISSLFLFRGAPCRSPSPPSSPASSPWS